MDRHVQGAPHEGSYPLQPQHPHQAPRAPVQSQYGVSYRPAIPSGSEMPDEWGYPASSVPQVSTDIPRHVGPQTGPTNTPHGAPPPPLPQAVATIPIPICRYPNCNHAATWDVRTYEFAEYCGLEHMRDAVQRLGVPLCPACGKYPRRTDSRFCGSLCEAWAVQREQQLQLRQEPRPQQEHQQWHQQNLPRQHLQPSSIGSPSVVPNPGAVTWSNAARTSALPNNASPHSWQGRYQQ